KKLLLSIPLDIPLKFTSGHPGVLITPQGHARVILTTEGMNHEVRLRLTEHVGKCSNDLKVTFDYKISRFSKGHECLGKINLYTEGVQRQNLITDCLKQFDYQHSIELLADFNQVKNKEFYLGLNLNGDIKMKVINVKINC